MTSRLGWCNDKKLPWWKMKARGHSQWHLPLRPRSCHYRLLTWWRITTILNCTPPSPNSTHWPSLDLQAHLPTTNQPCLSYPAAIHHRPPPPHHWHLLLTTTTTTTTTHGIITLPSWHLPWVHLSPPPPPRRHCQPPPRRRRPTKDNRIWIID